MNDGFTEVEETAHLSESSIKIVSLNQKKKSIKTQIVQLDIETYSGEKQSVSFSNSPFRIGTGPSNQLILKDPYVSDQHCRFRIVNGAWTLRDLSSTNGTFFNYEQAKECRIKSGDQVKVGKTNITIRLLQKEEYVQASFENEFCGMIGKSQSMRELYAMIRRVAPADVPILIHGESGTGKELVAKSLHTCSPRRKLPFIAINCGAISPELIESELFGHEKGAFTGAQVARKGVFEAAGEGTLFLDEIGELPLKLQTRLLRVLEERTIRRVGSSQEIKIACRILAATHRNLEEKITEGKFREDLFYRLNIIPLKIEPLRRRSEDIPLIVKSILSSLGGVRMSDSALKCCLEYAWPGNVRELKNTLTKASFLRSNNSQIEEEDLQLRSGKKSITPPKNLGESEKEMILKILKERKWNKTQAAYALGISKSTLFRKLRKLDIQGQILNPKL